jgi:hypothetical protein
MKNNNYNGWTNYETWLINLEYFDGFNPDGFNNEQELSSYLEECIYEDINDQPINGFIRTIAMDFLKNVNFDEIAKNILSNYK